MLVPSVEGLACVPHSALEDLISWHWCGCLSLQVRTPKALAVGEVSAIR